MSRLFFIIALLPLTCWSQSINNVRATFQDGKITITYDITGGNEKQVYNVSVYSSHDNFSIPLLSVDGDVGPNKQPGVSKSIVWDAKLDLGEYKGPLTFRVSADPVPLPYSFTKPNTATSYRRGKQATIEWEGGVDSDNITIELMKDGAVLQQLSNARNSGIQNWAIPKDMEKGAGYSLRLRSSSDQSITSNLFSIKSKIPLVLKIAPVVVVGGVVALLASGGSDPDPVNGGGTELPVAPAAPN